MPLHQLRRLSQVKRCFCEPVVAGNPLDFLQRANPSGKHLVQTIVLHDALAVCVQEGGKVGRLSVLHLKELQRLVRLVVDD